MFDTLTRMGASAAGTDEDKRSLKFYDTGHLTRTPSGAGNSKTWTVSFWMKLAKIGVQHFPFSTGADGNNRVQFAIESSHKVNLECTDGGSTQLNLISDRLFRDITGWYHFVISVDTTQATSSNRGKIYVNGEQLTDFSTENYPSQNDDLQWNKAAAHYIGKRSYSSHYTDGYIAEFYSVDGTALAPTSFGETDTDTGEWIPKEYTGSYGTNGFYLNFAGDSLNNAFVDSSSNARTVTTVGNAVHSTAQEKIGASSIRRPSSPNSCIHVPDSSDFDWGTNDWTLECWVRRDAQGADEWLMAHSDGTGANTSIGLHIWSSSVANSNKVNIRMRQSSSNLNCTGTTELAANTWYHVAGVRDGNTLRLYINGVQENTTSISGSPDTSSAPFAFTALRSNGDAGLTGYMDEIRVSNNCRYTSGTSFTPSTSAFSSDGNTLVLIHSDFTGTDIAADASGTGNHWTTSNISITAGVGNDSTKDHPTNNWCTFNPLHVHPSNPFTLTEGNLKWNGVSGNHHLRSSMTMPVRSGKWYVEFTGLSGYESTDSTVRIGVITANAGNRDPSGTALWYENTNGATSVNYGNNGTVYEFATATSVTGLSTFVNDDVMGIALDLDNDKLFISKNGTWFSNGTGTQDPAAGTNPLYSGGTLTSRKSEGFEIAWSGYDSQTAWGNFGSQGVTYTPPVGFKAICAKNLPDVTIKKGSDYFSNLLYNGQSSTPLTRTGVGFEPDMTWLKVRSSTWGTGAFTKLHGTGVGSGYKYNFTNTDAGEDDEWGTLTFGADGWSGVSSDYNGSFAHDFGASGHTFISWNWKESASAGFDMVSYTGDGTTDRELAHGLGVAPDFYLIKSKSEAHDWNCWHSGLASGQYGALNKGDAFASDSGGFMHGAPTSSVLKLGTWNAVNKDTVTYIAYCFTSVEGYCKIGKYVGNNSTDGPYIHLGFRPAFLMVKNASTAAEEWEVFDSGRDPYNVGTKRLKVSAEGAEVTSTFWDFVSSGLKARNTSGGYNNDGDTFLYIAFAESPFKYANAQ